MLMNREEMRELLIGPFATVPTAFDENYRVDYGRMYELTEWWIEMGLVNGKSVLKVAAAMGEGPQLRDSEWPTLLHTVVRAAKGRVPVMGAISYKDTVRAIEDAKMAKDVGIIANQVTTPALNGPTEEDNIRFFQDLSAGADIGIMIYNTHGMAGGAVSVDGFREIVKTTENVVAIKWSPAPEDRQVPGKFEEIFELDDRINVIVNCCHGPIAGHKAGGRGHINHTADVYPPHELHIWELMEKGEYDEAGKLYYGVEDALGKWWQSRNLDNSGGQGRFKKAMMAAVGQPMGASRPPSEPVSDDDINSLKELFKGFGWPV